MRETIVAFWEDETQWRETLLAAKQRAAPLRLWFPSHVAEVFEALTGRWGRFESAIARLETALTQGVAIELVHPLRASTCTQAVDLVRFIDDRLRGIDALWLVDELDESATERGDFQLWWRSTVVSAAARELRLRVEDGAGLPPLDPSAWSPPDRPAPSTHGVREQVALWPTPTSEGDHERALKELLEDVGTLARFIRPSKVSLVQEEWLQHLAREPRDRARAAREPLSSTPAVWLKVNLSIEDDGSTCHPDPSLLSALIASSQTLETHLVVCLCLDEVSCLDDPLHSKKLQRALLAHRERLEALCLARDVPALSAQLDLRPGAAPEEPSPSLRAHFDYAISLGTMSLQGDSPRGVVTASAAPLSTDPSTTLSTRPSTTASTSLPALSLEPSLESSLGPSLESSLESRSDKAHQAREAALAKVFSEPSERTALTNLRFLERPFDRLLTPPGEWLPYLYAAELSSSARPPILRLSDDRWLPLSEALRADLWLSELPSLGLWIAGTDPMAMDRWWFDALQPLVSAPRWFELARTAGCPYAMTESADVRGQCPAEVLNQGPVAIGRGRPLTILGLACTTLQNHSAALLRNGEIVAAVQEERLRRRKQLGWHPPGRPQTTVVSDPTIALPESYPWRSIQSVLDTAGLTMDDVDVLAFNGIPARYFSTYGLRDPARPPRTIWEGSRVFIPHHLAHAASAWRVAGLPTAPVLTIDGRGERETAAFFQPNNGKLERRFDVLALGDGAIGGVYESATTVLGFGRYGQGSTMGLAAMGEPTMALDTFLSVRRHDDVSVHERALQEAYAHLGRSRDGPLYDEHFALAASVQDALERAVIALIEEGLGSDKVDALCLAGGVALNCSMNSRLRSHFGLDKLFIQPAATDGGTALGAALEAHFEITGQAALDEMTHAALGPSYGDARIATALGAFGIMGERRADVATEAAELIAQGEIVCWFQGRMEFGPRALGSRSILADPRSPRIKDRLNVMKGRQWWRPLGPSILAGREAEWFEHPTNSPFMLLAMEVKAERRAEIPAVLHLDGTSRPQSVSAATHPRFHALISHFEAITGIPMVVNTSFNTAFEPIVCTPEDAIATFLQLGADHLVMGDRLVSRARLPSRALPLAGQRREG